MNLDNNRLINTLKAAKQAGRRALLPFLTAGYPELDTTEALLQDFAARGVRVCELGFPFSDPVADGAVIQASYTEALAKGVTSEKIFRMVKHFRDSTKNGGPAQAIALVGMVSFSIVFRKGVQEFCNQAASAGFDGLIIPDLPLDEAKEVERMASACGLALVMLVAPTTPPERRLEIARHSRGFVYYISVAGTTGERDRLPDATIAGVIELRKHTDTPVCVGFGIAKAATVKSVCEVADGAIVGSAIVHRVQQAAEKGLPREQLVKQVGEFVGELMSPIQ